MNKSLIFSLVLFPAALLAADVTDAYKSNGGIVKRPNTQVGRIVYVNCQKTVDAAVLRDNAAKFEAELNFGIDVEDGTFSVSSPSVRGNASLFVVDDPALPTLLAAPEDRWVMVNLSKVVRSSDDANVRASRVTKELSRGFAFLGGAYISQFNRTLLDYMPNLEALDTYRDWQLPYDALQKMRKFLPVYGLQPFEPVSYRDACYEGWAAAPKDEWQRAIMKEEREARAKDDAAKKNAK